ncbi:MAG: hypothetical protein AB1640_19955, partial [bacterium]
GWVDNAAGVSTNHGGQTPTGSEPVCISVGWTKPQACPPTTVDYADRERAGVHLGRVDKAAGVSTNHVRNVRARCPTTAEGVDFFTPSPLGEGEGQDEGCICSCFPSL